MAERRRAAHERNDKITAMYMKYLMNRLRERARYIERAGSSAR